MAKRNEQQPAGQAGPEDEAEAVVDLPERDAMSLINPASMLGGGALSDPTGSNGILNQRPTGASIPGIGNLGVSGLPQPPSIPTES